MPAEIHIFIIWNAALSKAERILDKLKNELRLLDVFEVNWTAGLYNKNLGRFYNFPSEGTIILNKVSHCGRGPFLLVVCEDGAPKYEFRNTTKGFQFLNSKIFDLKKLLRTWTGDGHRIHATNNEMESMADLMLLTGSDLSEYRGRRNDWDAKIVKLYSDLVGAEGWENLPQIFRVLNATTKYVVLRNFDVLPDRYYSENHGDIDLLVSNFSFGRRILNAEYATDDPDRILVKSKIADEVVFFDLRSLEDNYYDPKWELDILLSRDLLDRGFFVPDKINLFYTLLYHSLIHKPYVSPDYTDRLATLAKELGMADANSEFFSNPKKMVDMLNVFMRANGYEYKKPNDRSVHFNLPEELDEINHLPSTPVITEYGPKLVSKGEYFNRQSSGHSCIWIKGENITHNTAVLWEGKRLETFIGENGMVSATVPSELYNRLGTYYISLIEEVVAKQSERVTVEVL